MDATYVCTCMQAEDDALEETDYHSLRTPETPQMTRKDLDELWGQDEIDAEAGAGAGAEEEVDEALIKAATKIQAVQRGKLVRNERYLKQQQEEHDKHKTHDKHNHKHKHKHDQDQQDDV